MAQTERGEKIRGKRDSKRRRGLSPLSPYPNTLCCFFLLTFLFAVFTFWTRGTCYKQLFFVKKKKKIVSNFKYKLVKKRWVLINFPLFCEVTNGFYCKRPNWRNCQHRKMTKFLQEILRGIIWLYLLSAAISFEKKKHATLLKIYYFFYFMLFLCTAFEQSFVFEVCTLGKHVWIYWKRWDIFGYVVPVELIMFLFFISQAVNWGEQPKKESFFQQPWWCFCFKRF